MATYWLNYRTVDGNDEQEVDFDADTDQAAIDHANRIMPEAGMREYATLTDDNGNELVID